MAGCILQNDIEHGTKMTPVSEPNVIELVVNLSASNTPATVTTAATPATVTTPAIAATSECLMSMDKLMDPMQAVKDIQDKSVEKMDMPRVLKMKKPFNAYKEETCARFAKGVLLLKGTESLHDHNGIAMDLTAHASRVSWDDGNRIENESFGLGTNCDTFGALAEDMVEGCTREKIVNNQALCIAIGNTQNNAEVHTMPASSILVLAAVGKDGDKDNKMVPLYSADYFEAFAEYYSMAGGIFTGSDSLTSKSTKCAKSEESASVIDLKILGEGQSWKHPDARGWAHHHFACGLTSDKMIIVNRRAYIMPESSLAIVTRTYGTGLIKLSSTSSGMFSLEMRDNCYSNHDDPIRNCSGVWKKNANTDKIEMCAIQLGKSDMDFTTKNVSSMQLVEPEEKKKDIKEQIKEEIKEEKEEKATVLPSTGLYPFVNNKSLRGVFMATLCTGYRKIPVKRSFCQAKGATRGGAVRGRVPLPSPEASDDSGDDMETTSELTFPTIEAGTALYEMKGLPAYDANTMELCAPCYTILDVLVYAEDEHNGCAIPTQEDEDVKSVKLVQAVAEQIRNFNKMTIGCSKAAISSMQDSSLLIKKKDMTEQDTATLVATKAINANASSFFGLY